MEVIIYVARLIDGYIVILGQGWISSFLSSLVEELSKRTNTIKASAIIIMYEGWLGDFKDS